MRMKNRDRLEASSTNSSPRPWRPTGSVRYRHLRQLSLLVRRLASHLPPRIASVPSLPGRNRSGGPAFSSRCPLSSASVLLIVARRHARDSRRHRWRPPPQYLHNERVAISHSVHEHHRHRLIFHDITYRLPIGPLRSPEWSRWSCTRRPLFASDLGMWSLPIALAFLLRCTPPFRRPRQPSASPKITTRR